MPKEIIRYYDLLAQG